ncbi:MAG TPA: DoxX family protein [Flavisolibacter sp.]|nr:DoxX family protein [Flavisolibacter sp.]
MSQITTATKNNVVEFSWLTILRVALGLILIWKGITFVRDITRLEFLIKQTGVGVFTQNDDVLALVVTMLTLLCGFFITVGLFTRIASIVQIPVVLVALLFVHIKTIDRNGFELVLTIAVLILLVLFAIKGSGTLSADEYFRRGAEQDKTSDRALR